jgi:thiol-disulfide isomerase/thioredoxin
VVIVALLAGCVGDQSRLQVGTIVPSLRTKTLSDVGGDLAKITTYRYPDERMYQLSLDDALKSGKPVVLEFATPAHCTVCDNQLNMLKALLDKYQDQVIFLHMDQYQNAVAFRAYQVLGDPWTFVIDNGNVVRFKRPGRMLYQELDAVIAGVLQVSAPANADAS